MKLGAIYLRVGENAVPTNMTDSDALDGHTNAKGWVIYGTRQLWKNTDLGFTIYTANVHKSTGSAFTERIRAQWDLKIKF